MMGGTAIDTSFVVFLLTILGAIATVWWRIEGAIKAAKKELQEDYKSSINSALSRADAAFALVQLISTQLNEYKLKVADEYVRRDGIKDLREQIMRAIDELKGQVSDIRGRLERFVELEVARDRRDDERKS